MYANEMGGGYLSLCIHELKQMISWKANETSSKMLQYISTCLLQKYG